MSSNLPTLTVEVVEAITVHLESADLRSLRLVCRELDGKTLRDYGRRNFATVKTDLSRKSLQRLQNISESEHLALHVQYLHIEHPIHGNFGQGFDWRRHPSGCLIDEPNGADLLRDILSSKLPRCRSFHVQTYDEYRPFHETDCIIPSDAVGIILSIIAKASLALRAFTIQSSHDGNGRLVTPRLQMPLSQTANFVAAWSHIEELVLYYAITLDQGDWVTHLIASAPRLRKLSLSFYEAGPSSTTLLNSLQKLTGLEELTLSSANVTVDNISTLLLNNSETLHSLNLRHIKIENHGTFATVLANIKGHLPHLHHFVLFWLKQEPTKLYFVFSQLTRYPLVPESEHPAPHRRLKYERRRIDSVPEPVELRYWGTRRRVVGVEYHGSGIDHILGALVDTVETM